MDFEALGKITGAQADKAKQRKLYLTDEAADRLQQAADTAGLSLSRTAELIIMQATEPSEDAAPPPDNEEDFTLPTDQPVTEYEAFDQPDDFDPLGED